MHLFVSLFFFFFLGGGGEGGISYFCLLCIVLLLFVGLSLCIHDYYNTNEQVSLK